MISTYVTLNSASTVEASAEAIGIPSIEVRPTGRASPVVSFTLPAYCNQQDAELIVAALQRAITNARQRQDAAHAARRMGDERPDAVIALAAQRVADQGGAS